MVDDKTHKKAGGRCEERTLCPDDLIRRCVLPKGHAGFCDGGVK